MNGGCNRPGSSLSSGQMSVLSGRETQISCKNICLRPFYRGLRVRFPAEKELLPVHVSEQMRNDGHAV